jgi:thiamine-monophosphate kinase
MKVRDMGEFPLIDRISSLLVARDEEVICGIGDDAAVLVLDGERALLVTVDALVEGVHFTLRTHTPYQLGYKAMAVNVSDIAAMGGEPKYAFVSLSIRSDLSVRFVEEMYAGMEDMARESGISIVGGDTTESRGELFISVALIGECLKEEVVYRSGARPGDAILLTGPVGDSAAGLFILSGSNPGGLSGEEIEYLKLRHLMPRPRLCAARRIASLKLAHAMIDVSDGVSSEINHICRMSGVGAEIYAERVPISEPTRKLASAHGISPLRFALDGGEDYELLLTASEEVVGRIGSELAGLGLQVSVIGRITSPERGCVLKDKEGEIVLRPGGFSHFTSNGK